MMPSIFDDRDILTTILEEEDTSAEKTLRRAVFEALHKGETDVLAAFFGDHHPADTAAFLARLEIEETEGVLAVLPLARRAEVFGYLPGYIQEQLARRMGRQELVALISEMSADERVDLFNRLTEEEQEALLPALAQVEREDIRRLASYEEGTVGAIMTSEYAVLTPDLTVRQALDKLRREAPDKETIYRAYVIDQERKLVGSVRLQNLILAAPSALLAGLIDRNTLSIEADEPQEVAARQIQKYDILALPVVDGDGRLVGIVTHDDAMDVAEQEATEDFHKQGTVGELAISLKEAGITLLYRKRVFWLVLLVFGNVFSGAGIAVYEDTIAAHVALVFFLPLLIGSGGNAGSQSATLMVRALATGDVEMRDWGRMLGREILVAALLGATMAVAVSAVGMVRSPEITGVVAASMVIIVMVGALIGMSLPFLLSRFNMDPASASSPLVTSIADAMGVIIYLAMATAFLDL